MTDSEWQARIPTRFAALTKHEQHCIECLNHFKEGWVSFDLLLATIFSFCFLFGSVPLFLSGDLFQILIQQVKAFFPELPVPEGCKPYPRVLLCEPPRPLRLNLTYCLECHVSTWTQRLRLRHIH